MARGTPEQGGRFLSPAAHNGAPEAHTVLTREILRWNHQINLVSRVDTARTLNGLVENCLSGWDLLVQALGEDERFPGCMYVDLGSGGGLPGLIWSSSRMDLGHQGMNCLVEPREKRAWFLQRVARELHLDSLVVQAGRWGDELLPVAKDPLRMALISMKALRLTDSQVLGGLAAALGEQTPPRVTIVARFMESEDQPLEALEESYVACNGVLGWHHESTVILGIDNPRLLLTRYAQ